MVVPAIAATGPSPIRVADENSRNTSLTLAFAQPSDTLLYLLLPLHHDVFGVTLAEAGGVASRQSSGADCWLWVGRTLLWRTRASGSLLVGCPRSIGVHRRLWTVFGRVDALDRSSLIGPVVCRNEHRHPGTGHCRASGRGTA
jgi:hypothetical protein